MKLIRLQVQNFAAIGNAEVEFGPGLNVLYGPNDLGKSTLAEAIRFALLLPHASSYCEPYVGWAGGGDPTIQLTFETEAQRIWRVTKRFANTGSSLLEWSKDGRDFEEEVRGRNVDGKLREILRWGIPEPGGARAPRGLPGSFLATALLSTQTDVSAILGQGLEGDAAGSGKEQIAAALQAVAQDPLFVELLKKTQEQRDAAYTDKGAKKTAKGSVFKAAADRVNEARNERDRLQKLVGDSEGAEQQLRDLTGRRAGKQEQWATAVAHCEKLELLARQAKDRSVAAEQIRLAEEEVRQIKELRNEVDATEGRVGELTRHVAGAREAVEAARRRQTQANAALASAQEAARAEQSDPAFSDSQLRLRRAAAERAVRDCEQRIEAVQAAKKLAEAASSGERELRAQQTLGDDANEALAAAETKETMAKEELVRCSLLERVLEIQSAEKQVKSAQSVVDSKAALEVRLEAIAKERAILVEQRKTITVPVPNALTPMRKLATELATARGALEVGIVATVTPHQSLDLTVQRDGLAVDSISIAQAQEMEANAELEIMLAGVVTFQVRGGRREAQARAVALENRWKQEVVPHLVAAGVTDVEGLGLKVADAQHLDAEVKQKDLDLRSLREQLAPLSGATDSLRETIDRAEACRVALGKVNLKALASELTAMGADVTAKLARRRQLWSKNVEAAREVAKEAANAQVVANERTRNLRSVLDSAISSRDLALKSFPEGVDTALAAATAEHAGLVSEEQKIAAELASLGAMIEAGRKRIVEAEREARANVDKADAAIQSAQKELEAAVTDHASQHGRLIELRKFRDAANLALAEDKLREASVQYNALPVPDQIVSDGQVIGARAGAAALHSELEVIGRDIHRTHGALEQVGGAVARERLKDATDAFEAAERQEREIEGEFEAWKLLLDQMKEADAAQASNLGFALVPSIADRFNQLTRQRYQTVKLDAQLATEGVVVAGTLRPASSLSVGTREQLSTLFRLSLAEYLRTPIVLDDQLVQSDGSRMEWFRTLLTEKAHTFQIIVMTCRPGDYLPEKAVVPEGSAVHADVEGAPVRAIDLGRALRRR
jgi:hypothetical protein